MTVRPITGIWTPSNCRRLPKSSRTLVIIRFAAAYAVRGGASPLPPGPVLAVLGIRKLDRGLGVGSGHP